MVFLIRMVFEINKYQPNPPLFILSPTKQLLCRSQLLGQSSAELRAKHMLLAYPATAYTASPAAPCLKDSSGKNHVLASVLITQ